MVYLMGKGIDREMSYEIMESVGKGKGLTDRHKKILSEADVPEWYIASCEKVRYLFPKAHAVEYTLTAFRLAWFKAHYPGTFYQVYLTEINCFAGIGDLLCMDITTIEKLLADIDANSDDYDAGLRSVLEVRLEMIKREETID